MMHMFQIQVHDDAPKATVTWKGLCPGRWVAFTKKLRLCCRVRHRRPRMRIHHNGEWTRSLVKWTRTTTTNWPWMSSVKAAKPTRVSYRPCLWETTEPLLFNCGILSPPLLFLNSSTSNDNNNNNMKKKQKKIYLWTLFPTSWSNSISRHQTTTLWFINFYVEREIFMTYWLVNSITLMTFETFWLFRCFWLDVAHLFCSSLALFPSFFTTSNQCYSFYFIPLLLLSTVLLYSLHFPFLSAGINYMGQKREEYRHIDVIAVIVARFFDDFSDTPFTISGATVSSNQ